jgi:hypothetical protein
MVSRGAIGLASVLVVACGNVRSDPASSATDGGGSGARGGGGSGARGGGGSGATGSDGSAAASGSSGRGGTAAGGSSGSGATAAGGTMGNGSRDAAVADAGIVLRACETDVRCNPGARCAYRRVDTHTSCVCDPTGHFICQGYHAPAPNRVCLQGHACFLTDGGTCGAGNAFCSASCTCQNGVLDCSYACTGSGPERDGQLCGDPNCQPGSYNCTYEDGACNYSVTCGGPVTGRCE